MTQYLVSWKGFPQEDAQWVPSTHITEEATRYGHYFSGQILFMYNVILYRSFDSPNPSSDIIQDSVGRLTLAIDNCLRKGSSRDFLIHVPFRHDVYHRLFDNKTTLFRIDFCNAYFKEGWDQCYKDYRIDDQHNYGVKLLYPVECRLYIKWMKTGHYKQGDGTINTKSKSFVEMARFKVMKINC